MELLHKNILITLNEIEKCQEIHELVVNIKGMGLIIATTKLKEDSLYLNFLESGRLVQRLIENTIKILENRKEVLDIILTSRAYDSEIDTYVSVLIDFINRNISELNDIRYEVSESIKETTKVVIENSEKNDIAFLTGTMKNTGFRIDELVGMYNTQNLSYTMRKKIGAKGEVEDYIRNCREK